MSPAIQSLVALAVVALAATWLVLRFIAKNKTPGCGGDCGCAPSKVKSGSRSK